MSSDIETAYKLYNYHNYRVKVLGKPEHQLVRKYKKLVHKLAGKPK